MALLLEVTTPQYNSFSFLTGPQAFVFSIPDIPAVKGCLSWLTALPQVWHDTSLKIKTTGQSFCSSPGASMTAARFHRWELEQNFRFTCLPRACTESSAGKIQAGKPRQGREWMEVFRWEAATPEITFLGRFKKKNIKSLLVKYLRQNP